MEMWLQQAIESAMPPVSECVLVRDDGTEVLHPAVTHPYDKSKGDQNLSSRPELFERLTEHLDWGVLCSRGLRTANQIVTGRTSVTDRPRQAADHLRNEIRRRERRLVARWNAGLPVDGPTELESLFQAVPEQLDYDLLVLGCGVVILADPAQA
jgi:hypothetical protein